MLSDKSYSKGYVPSQADITVFKDLSEARSTRIFNVLHWENHIKSYEKQKASLSGVKNPLEKYGPVNIEDTTDRASKETKEDDNDDEESKKAKSITQQTGHLMRPRVDEDNLFGSDDEEESEGKEN